MGWLLGSRLPHGNLMEYQNGKTEQRRTLEALGSPRVLSFFCVFCVEQICRAPSTLPAVHDFSLRHPHVVSVNITLAALVQQYGSVNIGFQSDWKGFFGCMPPLSWPYGYTRIPSRRADHCPTRRAKWHTSMYDAGIDEVPSVQNF